MNEMDEMDEIEACIGVGGGEAIKESYPLVQQRTRAIDLGRF